MLAQAGFGETAGLCTQQASDRTDRQGCYGTGGGDNMCGAAHN